MEFIVWMLHGSKGLDDFNNKIVNEFQAQCHYFEKYEINGRTSFKVHAAVVAMMDSLSQHKVCEYKKTAMGDLLRLVRRNCWWWHWAH